VDLHETRGLLRLVIMEYARDFAPDRLLVHNKDSLYVAGREGPVVSVIVLSPLRFV
jgi:hypothetical protein